MKKLQNLLVVAFLVLLGGCADMDATRYAQPTTPAAVSRGSANFAKYVAIGNSLTAGFADGGLFRQGQVVSYPNLLAQQFARANGGAFVQPLFSEAQADGSGYLLFRGFLNNNTSRPDIVSTTGTKTGIVSASPLRYAKFTGTGNQNLGIPGIRLSDIKTPGYGTTAGNPFFERLLPDNSLTTYLDYVKANISGSSFFTCWLGNNDVLGYAASGGVAPMTDVSTFTSLYTELMTELVKENRRGAVALIPNVLFAAHFNAVTLSSFGLPGGVNLFIQTGSGVRAATANDRFLLGSQANYANIGSTTFGAGAPFPYGVHPNNPLQGQHVLDSDEVVAVVTRTAQLNAVIQNIATTNNIPVVNMDPVLAQAATPNGFVSDGLRYYILFLQGGVFGLDGIHLTPAGNALTANEFIKVINARYASAIPLLNTAAYPTISQH